MTSERRRFTRQTTAYREILAYTPGLGPLAKVKDISCGGLRIVTTTRTAGGPRNRLVDIFSNAFQGFIVSSIPCRIIYNIEQLSENLTFSGSPSRVVGIAFHHLTKEQRDKLDMLIQSLSVAT